MKQIRIILILFGVCAFFIPDSNAQLLKKLKKTVKRTSERNIERRTAKKTDKTIDEIIDGKKEKRDSSQPQSQNKEEKNNSKKNQNSKKGADLSEKNIEADDEKDVFEMYSKFDFEPGEKIIHFDDFERAEVGDFPTAWNTMGASEIVELNTVEGKWLKLSKTTGGLIPYELKEFPKNFTLEFDVIHNIQLEEYGYKRNLSMIFTNNEDPESLVDEIITSKNQMVFSIIGGIGTSSANLLTRKTKEGKKTAGKRIPAKDLFNKENLGESIHISFWRQDKRMRMYINHKKVYDIPLGWSMSEPIQAFRFLSEISRADESYLISNIRMAVGLPDTRSKLITEGKLITYGITFATNSAVVNPFSYGTIKSIADVLKEHEKISIEVVGHTDNVGADESNLTLSQRRSEAVKDILVNQFGINAERIKSSGKGESEPLAENDTAEGKAKNRRVEFIKIDK